MSNTITEEQRAEWRADAERRRDGRGNTPGNQRVLRLLDELDATEDALGLAMSSLTTALDVLHKASGLPDEVDDIDVIEETVLGLASRAQAAEANAQRFAQMLADIGFAQHDARLAVARIEALAAKWEWYDHACRAGGTNSRGIPMDPPLMLWSVAAENVRAAIAGEQ